MLPLPRFLIIDVDDAIATINNTFNRISFCNYGINDLLSAVKFKQFFFSDINTTILLELFVLIVVVIRLSGVNCAIYTPIVVTNNRSESITAFILHSTTIL